MDILSPENITGALALIFTFSMFFFDKKKVVLWLQVLSLIFYSLNLYLFGAVASALFLFIQVFRNILFAMAFPQKVYTMGVVFFIGISVWVYWLKSVVDPLSWLSLIGSILGTIACWVTNTRWMRILFFIGSLFWLYYVISLGMLYPILLQTIFISSLAINITRFDILGKSEKSNTL